MRSLPKPARLAIATLYLRLRDGATLVARFGGRAPIRLADPVAVSVDVAAAHVFDPVSGRALHHPE